MRGAWDGAAKINVRSMCRIQTLELGCGSAAEDQVRALPRIKLHS